MKVDELKSLVERNPFRPFAVRLSNGEEHEFHSRREVGATGDYHLMCFFGEKQLALIDTASIAEIFVK